MDSGGEAFPARALFVLVLLLLSCASSPSNDNIDCHAAVDCAENSACVEGACIDDVSQCSSLGVFVDIFDAQPQNADRVDELHVALDDIGAVHYCYHGTKNNQPVSYYGVQTAWNSFTEQQLKIGEWDAVRCGALTVTPEGVPYFLLREPAGVVYPDENGAFVFVELRDLTGLEPSGALKGSRTLISLTPDTEGGVYLALSLGFELGSQPIYLARVSPNGSLETLVNGWSDSGEYSATGHAPQFVLTEAGAEMIMGRLLSFKVLKADTNLEITAEQEGAYPRAAIDPNGDPFVAYMDHNKYLHLDRIVGNEFQPFTRVGKVEIPENDEGQIPWELTFDSEGKAHLLIEDATQGAGKLTYRTVDTGGNVSAQEILTESLTPGLPGMQRYAIGTDLCGRPIIAAVSDIATDAGVQDLPAIAVMEGR